MNTLSKHYFPGGNTTEGFYNYYDYIVDRKEVYHIYCIKGGPGVGKSTFMKNIGSKYESEGNRVEYFHCSSDNQSLDGVLLKDKNILFVDGTAPHIVDPKYPGAVDTILNFGDFFHEGKLKLRKKEIMEISTKISKYFQRAYDYLAAIKPLYEGLNHLYQDALKIGNYQDATNLLVQDIFKDQKGEKFEERKLFLSAITPDGLVNYINETIDSRTVYILNSLLGDISFEILDRILFECRIRNFKVECFYCPFSPKTKIDHLIIPELDIAIVTTNYYHPFKKSGSIVDLPNFYDLEKLDQKEISLREKMIEELLAGAVHLISQAKTAHDKLEEYYKDAMDFNNLSLYVEELKKRL